MSSNRFQILALSGGGYRGLFSATFLQHCEEKFDTKCRDRFDLIAGTSMGALIAAGLACGIPAKVIAEKTRKHGVIIFKNGPLEKASRFLFAAPYATKTVRDAIEDTISKDGAAKRLSEIDAPLAITTVNYTTGAPRILRSRGLDPAHPSDVTLSDAILASAAAPTFFPLKQIDNDDYLDGGLVANAPDLIALVDALTLKFAELDKTYMLSVGTAGRRKGAALTETEQKPGGASWIVGRGLVNAIMATQEALAIHQAGALLGGRYLRVDKEPNQAQNPFIKELDMADEKATRTLSSMAKECWRELETKTELRNFFAH